ncbi:hypothetical protein [Schlesneria paludicola]|uniref:hypothetical protein n=1 Tax=Schlesneria paludicola TaxID=360056 RepID=UPI00029B4403|nr:hypothetical protein [Schlesneria paludicola]
MANSNIPPNGQFVVDTEKQQLFFGDGVTEGGLVYRSAESLGAKLRSLAAAAPATNPYAKPPMFRLLPWKYGMIVNQGMMVANGGNAFVAYAAGTTATSGNGPTNTSASGAADNTTGWIYTGPIEMTSDVGVTDPAWTGSQEYTAGALAINGSNLYACIVGGTSASSGGPTGTGVGIADGSVTWNYYGPVRSRTFDFDIPVITAGTTAPSGLGNLYNGSVAYNTVYPGTVLGIWLVTGGTGYAVGDLYYPNGGTFTTQASFKVTAIGAGGVITSADVQQAGSYSIGPTVSNSLGVLTQGSTTGSGTGATFIAQFNDPFFCKYRGMYYIGDNAGILLGGAYQASAGVTSSVLHGAIEFYSDTPRISFREVTSTQDFQ